MRRIRFSTVATLAVALGAVLLAMGTGCSRDVPALYAPAQVLVDSGARAGTFFVDANSDWTMTFDAPADWCTVAPMSGSGMRTTPVTVTVQENNDTVRTATLTIVMGGTTRQVVITQGLDGVVYFDNPISGTLEVDSVAEGAALPFKDIILTTPFPADSDRHVSLAVSSADGEKGVLYDYDSPDLVIAAGTTATTFTVRGIYAGFGALDTATLTISIASSDFVPVRFNQTYTLILKKIVPTPPEPPASTP